MAASCVRLASDVSQPRAIFDAQLGYGQTILIVPCAEVDKFALVPELFRRDLLCASRWRQSMGIKSKAAGTKRNIKNTPQRRRRARWRTCK